ncbi:hypothetical protein GOZ89_24655 [Agrobacterium vitis]|uniref:DUF6602 domain-containing protein n=1 Tax=Agrobacterium vitis TaxID=373 RepID=UPI0012E8F557|nr:DUF6602 domain-containing protein [Agrobacterium vitis]MVA82600.1 hypothetical protein [Agrobacterium vitis]
MSFDGPAFILHVARRLVQEFEFSAGAGTPGLIGAAKEHPARQQLEKLMPEGIAVGSGIVVDSYGGVSRQQDIVIFEKICPVFTHNGTPEATYYPVEGVIACGEVKSTLGKSEIADVFEKSSSVKTLKRHAVATDDGLGLPSTVSYRNYGMIGCYAATKEDEYDQEKKSLHQIYTFALCEKFSSLPKTTLENVAQQARELGKELAPNFIASLKDGFIVPHNSLSNSITRASFEADGIIFSGQPDQAFSQLMSMVRIYVRAGKTVDGAAFERYFKPLNGEAPQIPMHERVSF